MKKTFNLVRSTDSSQIQEPHLSRTETCMALSDAVSDTTMTNNYGYNEKIY